MDNCKLSLSTWEKSQLAAGWVQTSNRLLAFQNKHGEPAELKHYFAKKHKTGYTKKQK